MKNLNKFFVGAVVSALMMTSCQNESTSNDGLDTNAEIVASEGNIIPGQYIVTFKNSEIAPTSQVLSRSAFTSREAKAKSVDNISEVSISKMDAVLSKNALDKSNVLHYYTTEIVGMAVKLTEAEFQQLSKDPSIDNIEFDRIVELPENQIEKVVAGDASQRMAQQTPCGITRAGGAANGTNRSQWIWIVDSGIDLDHPDLNVVTNTTYARNFFPGFSNADDCNGHGTHVAGTAAAINNGIGVVGVSAGANVVPVRVFGCGTSSATSTILAGINHVGRFDQPGDVVNLSLGGFFGSSCSTRSSYRSAVLALANGGSYVAIAAGNDAANAANYDPGCINGNRIYTVANMTCDGRFASTSNYNMNPIDVIATGTNVLSTWPGGRYATISGTSMASPHVAGIIHARNGAPRTSGSVTFRGERYPIAVR
ncbi:S8 family serine peptidase [Tenacibaculum sp. M341]|uniref:S8 family serine peptidase n=1 Tax=Tenacibaculum sp. M341 TaxID=2530339 RepID=UPI0010505764|nr:S8 family serine peptidase [Tenacibaculum sp. M341]TCI90383.1 S8 family peptidase [Tenacibaculum sp. M341]